MEEFITMSSKELRRAKVMQALLDKRLRQREAALELSLSIRHVRRLYKNYKKYGAKTLTLKSLQ